MKEPHKIGFLLVKQVHAENTHSPIPVPAEAEQWVRCHSSTLPSPDWHRPLASSAQLTRILTSDLQLYAVALPVAKSFTNNMLQCWRGTVMFVCHQEITCCIYCLMKPFQPAWPQERAAVICPWAPVPSKDGGHQNFKIFSTTLFWPEKGLQKFSVLVQSITIRSWIKGF